MNWPYMLTQLLQYTHELFYLRFLSHHVLEFVSHFWLFASDFWLISWCKYRLGVTSAQCVFFLWWMSKSKGTHLLSTKSHEDPKPNFSRRIGIHSITYLRSAVIIWWILVNTQANIYPYCSGLPHLHWSNLKSVSSSDLNLNDKINIGMKPQYGTPKKGNRVYNVCAGQYLMVTGPIQFWDNGPYVIYFHNSGSYRIRIYGPRVEKLIMDRK